MTHLPYFLEHKERPFFSSLIEFMSSGPVVPMVWQGQNIIAIAR
jgi:nucleoside-diphosphate kinase